MSGTLLHARRARRGFRARRRVSGGLSVASASMPWALTMALGFAVLTQMLLLAGMAGMLRKPVILAIAIGIHLAAIPAWRRLVSASAGPPRARARAVGALAVAAAALPAFLLTLYPPLGFDQTMYHLPFARAFAASGGVPFLPALRYPMFPPLAEVLNAAVLMFAGDVATQAAGWVALVACVGLAYAWARDLAGDSTASSRASGWLAAAIIVGSPIALYLAATGYVEPLLALFGGASLYAADRARITGDARWLVAAGVLAGSAASVKYLGLYFVPAAAILIVRRAPWRDDAARSRRSTASRRRWRCCHATAGWWRTRAIRSFRSIPSCSARITGRQRCSWARRGADALAPDRSRDCGTSRSGGKRSAGCRISRRRSCSPCPSSRSRPGVIAVFAGLLLIAIGYLLAAPTHAHYLFTIAVLWSALAGASAAVLLLSARSGSADRRGRHPRVRRGSVRAAPAVSARACRRSRAKGASGCSRRSVRCIPRSPGSIAPPAPSRSTRSTRK